MNPSRHLGDGWAWRIGLALALSLGAADPALAGPTFDGQGRVSAVDLGRSTVTIEHGAIQGLLPAAQSEFLVQSTSVIQSVRPGDRVRFTLGAADESHGLLTVLTLIPEAPGGAGWPDRLIASMAVALGILTLTAVLGAGIGLRRELRSLQRRVVTLDREAGMLRGLIAETQDGVRQIARALEEAVTVLRVGYLHELQRRLAPRSPTATAEAPGSKSSGEPAGMLVVVQRGRGDLYRAIAEGAAGPDLAVIWDRRRGERRRNARRPVGHERRRSERRGAPPETWTRLGFHLVPQSPVDVARTARLLRPASGQRGTPR
jgi:Cu/Ag efflux protein CusF